MADKKMSLREAVATIDGDSRMVIYDFLAIKRAVGRPGSPCGCPVAIYLSNLTGEQVTTSRAIAWIGSTLRDGIALPGAVAAFVLDFDMNPERYPRVLKSYGPI